MMWANRDELLACDHSDECDAVLDRIVAEAAAGAGGAAAGAAGASAGSRTPICTELAKSGLALGNTAFGTTTLAQWLGGSAQQRGEVAIVNCGPAPMWRGRLLRWPHKGRFLQLPLAVRGVGLNGNRRDPKAADVWRSEVLPAALPFILRHLKSGRRVVVVSSACTCSVGNGSVGADNVATILVLAALVAFCDDRGEMLPSLRLRDLGSAGGFSSASYEISKTLIRKRFAWLQVQHAQATLPRNLFKELTRFFLTRGSPWLEML